MKKQIPRRTILKAAGLGSVAAAALPALLPNLNALPHGPDPTFGHTLARFARADDDDDKRTGFRFVSNSRTATVGGVRHTAQFNGDGRITRSEVEGGGVFNLYVDTSPVPKTIELSGTWKAKSLTSFTLIGAYGAIAAGILQMDVHLVPNGGPVVEAKLRVVCNIGAAGLNTGEEEGFVLDIPGTAFTAGGTFGPFEPFMPVPGGPTMGITAFNPLNERED